MFLINIHSVIISLTNPSMISLLNMHSIVSLKQTSIIWIDLFAFKLICRFQANLVIKSFLKYYTCGRESCRF